MHHTVYVNNSRNRLQLSNIILLKIFLIEYIFAWILSNYKYKKQNVIISATFPQLCHLSTHLTEQFLLPPMFVWVEKKKKFFYIYIYIYCFLDTIHDPLKHVKILP